MNITQQIGHGIECDVYCIECLPKEVSVDHSDVAPIFADSEWGYVPVCCECGCEHDYVSILGD